MYNRIEEFESEDGKRREAGKTGETREPQPVGAILAELFSQYQACFPGVRIAVVETPAVAV